MMLGLRATLQGIRRTDDAWVDVLYRCAEHFLMDFDGVSQNPRHRLAEFCEANPARRDEVYAWLAQHDAESDADRVRRERNQNIVDQYTRMLHLVEPGVPEYDPGPFRDRPESVVQQARQLVDDWQERLTPGLVTLSGPPGTGKSHLAIRACQRLSEDGKVVVYRAESHLVRELQEGIRTNTTEEYLDELCQVPWLVLDEMFISGIGAWTQAHIDTLINARWENSEVVRTLVTTNAVGEQISPRIASRLSDVRKAKTLVVRASDYRRTVG